MRHLTQNELVLFRYGEMKGGERREVEAHLQSCPLCRRELADIERTLETVDRLPVPERDDNYGSEVWARIRPELAEKARNSLELSASVPRVGAGGRRCRAGGGGILERQTLAAAPSLGGGRRFPRLPAQRILMVAVGDHLERAQMLLVEIMHQPAAGPADVSETRQLAQDLVESNRLYRQTALRDGDAGMASVLDELERVLLHISHSPNEISADELVSLQHQIESQGILFKVRVVQSEVQEKQKVAEPHPAENRALKEVKMIPRYKALTGATAVLLMAAASLAARPQLAGPEESDPVPAPANPSGATATPDRESDLYNQGTQALDASQWQAALEAFDQVARMHGPHADGALYWKAYALNKLGRREDALSALTALETDLPPEPLEQ